MGKGPKRRKKKQEAVIRDILVARDREPSGGSGRPGGGTAEDVIRCWDFFLKEVTPAAKALLPGMPIAGSREGARIVVHTRDEGPVGYAPSSVAAEIQAEASQRGGSTLSGSVLDDFLQVRLCLS